MEISVCRLNAVQDSGGKPILLDATKPVEVAPDGAIRQAGEDIAQLAVVTFKDTSALRKRGNNYFQVDPSSLPPVAASLTEVQQGKLEAANSQPAESAVRLVNILRQFETLQKVMNIGVEMNRSAVQEVAKVTQ